MSRWKWHVPLAVVAALVGGAWYGLRQIRASVGYGVRVPFEQLPPNDGALEAWWKAQPGVVSHTVYVERKGNAVGVLWVMSQYAGRNEPPVPDFLDAFKALGYREAGPVHYDWRGSNDW